MCEHAYYPPSWGLLGLVSLVLATAVAAPVPTISPSSRAIWLGLSIPTATLLYMAFFYAMCWRHVVRVEESMSQGLRPAVGAPTKEVRRIEKVACMLLSELENKRIAMVQENPDAVTLFNTGTNSPLGQE